ncbi:MAG: phage holin family protein [Pseudonocardiaceae bacterium]
MSRVSRAKSPTATNGRHRKQDIPAAVPSIPMYGEQSPQPTEASLGGLVREATTHLSTLIRSEMELAKAELAAEVRKGVKGSLLFGVALTVLLFSLFFLFFALGEVLAIWLQRWAAFSIVFGIMVATAAMFGLLGYLRVRGIRKPERTITSVRETAALASRRGKR